MALPKYPELKNSIEAMLLDYFEKVSQNELGPFKGVRRFQVHEGETLSHNTLDNNEDRKETSFQEVKIEYGLSHSDIANMNFEDVKSLIDKKAAEFGGEQAKLNYKAMNEVTEETGNKLELGGRPLSPDVFLEAISKISISFDKSGNPEMPTMVIHPNQTEAAKKLIKDAENDGEHKKKFDELMAKKKEEFDAEQASRKLVD